MSDHSMIIMSVLKRDGRIAPFDSGKIRGAIEKAMEATGAGVDSDLAAGLTGTVVSDLESFCGNSRTDTVKVDVIHEFVERALMGSRRKDAAQEYIRYRNQRQMARKADSVAIFRDIVNAQANEITRENANMNADTPAGMMMKFASESSKTFVDECLLSAEAQAAVKANLIHIHDKDYYPTKSLTCIQHPTDKFLREGFVDGHASVRPARRIETAATIACITMEAVQNEMHGGQAIPAFDFYMAPYVRMAYEEEVDRIAEDGIIFEAAVAGGIYLDGTDFEEVRKAPVGDYVARDLKEQLAVHYNGDKEEAKALVKQLAVNRTVKRVHQAMESFVHNMNTIHSRGGNQVVFSSINYGTDTSPEGRCVIREILNTTFDGVGNGETAIFPIQIWKKKKGVSYLPKDPNYDLYCYACKVSAKRFFPNFLNLDASFNVDDAWKADDPRRFEHEVATMGCRTRVYENRFGPKTSIGRGNLSFTTVNLPGIAIECMAIEDREERISSFFSLLGEVCDVAARQLDDRFRFQATALAKQFPMLMSGMWLGSENLGKDDRVEPVINQGTLGIGFIGLAECLVALTGEHHGESAEAQELGLRIVSFMGGRVEEYCKLYRHNYSVLATPAEGLAGRFTRIDRKRHGIIPGVTDREYYTNSNHVPVYYKCTPSHKARIEGPYHRLTRGGHIFYVEMDGDAEKNPEAVMAIVDLMDRYDIGYGSVNHNRNRCLDCGYESSEKDLKVCPRCGSTDIDILQRITGYLVGTTERWNAGKKAELRDRVIHG